MQHQVEQEIKKLYNRISLQSNFQYRQYLRTHPNRLCRDINLLERALLAIILQTGSRVSSGINEMIGKIKDFVC
jgi:hypothetical protein